MKQSHCEKEDLSGEERVGNGIAFAERRIAEAEHMRKSSGWNKKTIL
jgi:hypothetical protein